MQERLAETTSALTVPTYERDADYFLAVARSLLAGTNNPPVPSVLGQDARVAQTLADIQAEQLKTVGDFMGACRVVDFSQFKVRGHYTHTERLWTRSYLVPLPAQ